MRVDLVCGLSVQYHGSCSLHRVPIQKRVHAIISIGGGGGVRGESGLKAGLILRVVWVVGGRCCGPTSTKTSTQGRRTTHASEPPTLYGQYVRVPEGVALPHVLPVQGLGAAPSAVPRGGVARDAPIEEEHPVVRRPDVLVNSWKKACLRAKHSRPRLRAHTDAARNARRALLYASSALNC